MNQIRPFVNHKIRLPGQGGRTDDPLLRCLVLACKHFGKSTSAAALGAGLPMGEKGLTPALAVTALEKAGLKAGLVKVDLDRILPLSLPCILLLRNRQVCLLHGIDEEGRADIVLPDSNGGQTKANMDDLANTYQGQAIFIGRNPVISGQQPGTGISPDEHWFWPEIRKHWFVILQVILASLAVNVLALAVPLFVMNVYDRVVPNLAFETLWALATGVCLVLLFDFTLKNLRAYFVDATARNLDTLFSAKIFEKLMKISLLTKKGPPGAMANRIKSFERLRDFISSATLVVFIDLPFALVFITMIGMIGGPYMAMIPIIFGAVVMILGFGFHGPVKNIFTANFQGMAAKQGFLVETLQRLDSIKAMGLEGRMQYHWNGLVDQMADRSSRERRLNNLYITLSQAIGNLGYVIIIILGVYRIREGDLSLGGMIACSILNGRIMAPFLQFVSLLAQLHFAVISLASLNDFMALPDERQAGRNLLNRPDIQGKIEFCNLFFRYPQQPEPALKNISLTIQSGERIGIVGRSGSGKSTLLKLIMGFYPPNNGSARVDGIDVQQLAPAELRSAISYVTQDADLFTGTIRSNINFGSAELEDEMMIQSLALTGYDQTIFGHPLGLDRPVGPLGKSLSNGEKQSICLARALVGRQPILLFDEPTSALDMTTEQLLIQRLGPKLEGRTFVLVTQRLNMLQLVNRLLVMDNGMLLADGPKDQVIKALQSGELDRHKRNTKKS